MIVPSAVTFRPADGETPLESINHRHCVLLLVFRFSNQLSKNIKKTSLSGKQPIVLRSSTNIDESTTRSIQLKHTFRPRCPAAYHRRDESVHDRSMDPLGFKSSIFSLKSLFLRFYNVNYITLEFIRCVGRVFFTEA